VWTYTKSKRIVRDSEDPDPEDPEDPEEVDKEALEAKIEEVANLNEQEYTEDSWANLQTALVAAEAVVANDDATQAEVDQALENLIAAIEGLEPVEEEPEPGEPQLVEAVFLENQFLRNFGYVRIQVVGIEGAAKYRVQFFLNDKDDGKIPEWTEIMNIEGDDYESNLIFYMPEDKLTIEIYAEDGEILLHTFRDVVPTRQ
jgi:hypothetical protein